MTACFRRSNKPAPDLHTICTQNHRSKHSFARRNTTGSDQRDLQLFFNHRNQRERRSFLATVMPSCFKTFSHHSINTCLLGFQRKLYTTYYVHYFYTVIFQMRSPGFRISGAGKYNLNSFFDNDLHQFIDIRIQQWYIYAKRLCSCCFTFLNMFTQYFGIHRTRTYKSQTTGITHSTGEFPTAVPYHSGLNEWIFNIKKCCDSIQNKSL